MHLINNQVFQRKFQLPEFSPVKIIFDYSCMIHKVFAVFRTFSPVPLPCHRPCIRIQQNIIFIKKKSLFLIIRPVQLECVFKFLNLQSEYQHGIRISYVVSFRIFKPYIGFLFLGTKQQQRTACGAMGMHRKTDPVGCGCRTIPVVKSRTNLKAIDLVQRL